LVVGGARALEGGLRRGVDVVLVVDEQDLVGADALARRPAVGRALGPVGARRGVRVDGLLAPVGPAVRTRPEADAPGRRPGGPGGRGCRRRAPSALRAPCLT